MPCLPQTILNSWTPQYFHATAVSPWTAFPTLFCILLTVHLLHALQLDCYYDTDTAPANNTCSAVVTALAAIPASVVVTTIAVAAERQQVVYNKMPGLQNDPTAAGAPFKTLGVALVHQA